MDCVRTPRVWTTGPWRRLAGTGPDEVAREVDDEGGGDVGGGEGGGSHGAETREEDAGR